MCLMPLLPPTQPIYDTTDAEYFHYRAPLEREENLRTFSMKCIFSDPTSIYVYIQSYKTIYVCDKFKVVAADTNEVFMQYVHIQY